MSSIVPHISLFDKSFSKSNSNDYILFINIDLSSFSYTILNTNTNTFIGLEKYLLTNIYNDYSLVEPLTKIVHENDLFKNTFKSINVSYFNHRSTLIPNPLYNENELATYHRFNFTEQEEDVYLNDKLLNIEAYNIYSIPDYVTSIFKGLDKIKFNHLSSALIESAVLEAKKNNTNLTIDINILASSFQVIVTKNKQLELYNSFQYQTSEDFIYYVLFVLNQLKINPSDSTIKLTGEVDKNSAIYDILYKYTNSLSFGNRPDNLHFSYIFEEIPHHHYYSLFNQFLCE